MSVKYIFKEAWLKLSVKYHFTFITFDGFEFDELEEFFFAQSQRAHRAVGETKL